VRGEPIYISVILATAIGLILGYVFSLATDKLDSASFSLVTFLGGLAGIEIIENWDSVTGGRSGLEGVDITSISANSDKIIIAIMLFCLGIVFLLLFQHLIKSPYGMSIRALRDDPEGAKLDGIEKRIVLRQTFILVGFHSTLVGAIWVLALPHVNPGMFSFWAISFPVVLACLLGGGERPYNIVIGSILVLALDQGSQLIPVPPVLRADVPLLVVGLAYLFVTITAGPERIVKKAVLILEGFKNKGTYEAGYLHKTNNSK